MSGIKAYFTPSPEEAPELVARLLLADAQVRAGITFYIRDEDSPSDGASGLEEVTINPVNNVCVSDKGFKITGERLGTIGVLAKLSVDTTVEPPIATYTELTE